MRILQVGKYYPPYQGGMETVLENLALGLLEESQDLSVMVASRGRQTVRESITQGDRKASLIRLGRWGVVASQPVTPGLVLNLRKELVRFRPEIVHLHLPNPLLGLAWAMVEATLPRRLRPPVLVSYHADITRQRWGRQLVGPSLRTLLKNCRGITVSSRALAEGSPVLEPFADKVRVIPFGIDPEPWVTIQSDGTGGFLFVGRLVRYKGLQGLVEAMGRVEGATLDLVGEGPLEGALRQQIHEAGLSQRVHLHGSLPRDQLVALMKRARGLVLPSIDRSETFGLVQLEAMAAGLPVIASDLPTGIREVGEADSTCLLVPPGDIAALVENMGRLQEDPELGPRLGARGRERFLERFTRSHMTRQILDWYRDILTMDSPLEKPR